MTHLDAKTVYDRLTELGHDHVPAKITYKSDVAGSTVTLYDPVNVGDDGKAKAVEIRAENVEHYVEKGFLFEQGKKIGPSLEDREKAGHDAARAAAKADLVAASKALNALGEDEEEAEAEAELEDMTIAELREVAEERGVDLTGASRKADILERLAAAEDHEGDPIATTGAAGGVTTSGDILGTNQPSSSPSSMKEDE